MVLDCFAALDLLPDWGKTIAKGTMNEERSCSRFTIFLGKKTQLSARERGKDALKKANHKNNEKIKLPI